jgi:hypothetical protein
MCDYSLLHVASRPAKAGDKLVSTKFSISTTGGFAAVGEPDIAVCVLPGTELAFERDVEFQNLMGALPNGTVGEKMARFRQINKDQPNVHHDALEFPNGQIVLLTRLCEGQHTTVLQLPVSPRNASEAQARYAHRVVGLRGH